MKIIRKLVHFSYFLCTLQVNMPSMVFNTVHGLNFVIFWDLILQLYIKQKSIVFIWVYNLNYLANFTFSQLFMFSASMHPKYGGRYNGQAGYNPRHTGMYPDYEELKRDTPGSWVRYSTYRVTHKSLEQENYN